MNHTTKITNASSHTNSYIRVLANAPGTFQQCPSIITSLEGQLLDGRRLTHPITIVIEFDDGEVVVSEPKFHMHASAATEDEALNAFRRIFSGYLDLLEAREKTLGPSLRDQLNYLRSVIASE